MPLPSPLAITLELVGDERDAPAGFLRLRRLRLVARYPDGSTSEPFLYDVVERPALDAVVIAAHFRRDGETWVFLRSAVRPPLWARDIEPRTGGEMWELPAGLVEPGEEWRAAGARELEEEIGVRVPPESLTPLGPFGFPAPGMIGEIHAYFRVEVDPASVSTPQGDSSPLERNGQVAVLPVGEVLALCARGEIRDTKTELALRRLVEAVG